MACRSISSNAYKMATAVHHPRNMNALLRLRMVLAVIFGLGICQTLADSPARKLTSVRVTVMNLGNPYFVALGRGAEDMARVICGNDVKINVVSAENSLEKQVTQMEEFASSGAQLILLNAVDSKSIAPAVQRATAAGAIVVAVDVAADGGVHATVTSDNKQAGEMAARYIVHRLKGRGNVVILGGPPVTAVQDRISGAMSVFSKSPGINVLSSDKDTGGNRHGGMRAMTELMAEHPKIDAVFAENDPAGIGADLAARQAQRSEFFIVAVDGSPEGEAALMDTESLFAATVAQNPYVIAAKGVEIGYSLFHGRTPTEKTTSIPVRLITRSNVREYKGWTRK